MIWVKVSEIRIKVRERERVSYLVGSWKRREAKKYRREKKKESGECGGFVFLSLLFSSSFSCADVKPALGVLFSLTT